ncbi:MAG: pyridoxal phosphate-dependent aminotransferase family protein [Alphaproteobacteria bacterium]|nr:pyridoxal phosphate-dependent aminotransferase family protein [Alphaproteobacteria bacterium]
MKEFAETAAWIERQNPHHIDSVDSLPTPIFRIAGSEVVSFSTNNYLALATSRRLVESAQRGLELYGVGNCESRLLSGDLDIYRQLEAKIARLHGVDDAVLFATGYLTNLGVLSAIPRTRQVTRAYGYRGRSSHRYAYFSDEYNHASIQEGIRMSRAEKATFRHCDPNHLESLLRKSDATTKIIVTDGVFSQDGDIAPLPEFLELANRYNAILYVDDAHGTGLLGADGGGTCAHFNIADERLIHMGTLSKAYGAIGGYIAAGKHVTEILRLTSLAYGFTSTLPPSQATAVSEAIDMVRDEPERRQRLCDNQRYFVARMAGLGYRLISTATPIVPILIGSNELADRFARLLRVEGIHVDAVKYPAVPVNKARLRIQLNAGHTRAHIDHLVDLLDAYQHLLGAESDRPHPALPAPRDALPALTALGEGLTTTEDAAALGAVGTA